jgi:hypothetical protein
MAFCCLSAFENSFLRSDIVKLYLPNSGAKEAIFSEKTKLKIGYLIIKRIGKWHIICNFI